MPLMRGMDPERAHDVALRAALRPGRRRPQPGRPDPGDSALGLAFRNPIGLAAGFDKSAVAVGALMRLASASWGRVRHAAAADRNPKPRLFRLVEDRAVINRMGMNNGGIDVFRARLAKLPVRGLRCWAPTSPSTRNAPIR